MNLQFSSYVRKLFTQGYLLGLQCIFYSVGLVGTVPLVPVCNTFVILQILLYLLWEGPRTPVMPLVVEEGSRMTSSRRKWGMESEQNDSWRWKWRMESEQNDLVKIEVKNREWTERLVEEGSEEWRVNRMTSWRRKWEMESEQND